VDLRVAGWSYGGTQAVNFDDSRSRAGKPVGGYKLQTAIPVQKLVTWDPVQALFLGPVPIFPHKVRWGRVKDNVKTFRNYWQWHTGFTRFKRQDQVAQPIVVGHPFTNFFHGDVVATDLTGDRVKQYRVDTDPVLSVANEDRDRVNAYSRDPADPDPTVAAGEPDWRIQGRQVNHMSVTWYAYRRSLDDLLA
jgi:hypothetical protein